MSKKVRIDIERIESLEQKFNIEINMTAYMTQRTSEDDDPEIRIELVGEVISDEIKHIDHYLEIIANVYNMAGEIIATGSSCYIDPDDFVGIETFNISIYDVPTCEDFGKLRVYPRKK